MTSKLILLSTFFCVFWFAVWHFLYPWPRKQEKGEEIEFLHMEPEPYLENEVWVKRRSDPYTGGGKFEAIIIVKTVEAPDGMFINIVDMVHYCQEIYELQLKGFRLDTTLTNQVQDLASEQLLEKIPYPVVGAKAY